MVEWWISFYIFKSIAKMEISLLLGQEEYSHNNKLSLFEMLIILRIRTQIKVKALWNSPLQLYLLIFGSGTDPGWQMKIYQSQGEILTHKKAVEAPRVGSLYCGRVLSGGGSSSLVTELQSAGGA